MMATLDSAKLVELLAYVESAIAASPVLQATQHVVSATERGVAISVQGAHYEARAWRHAFNGRIMPSHIDAQGIRTQLVICTSVEILVTEHVKRGL